MAPSPPDQLERLTRNAADVIAGMYATVIFATFQVTPQNRAVHVSCR